MIFNFCFDSKIFVNLYWSVIEFIHYSCSHFNFLMIIVLAINQNSPLKLFTVKFIIIDSECFYNFIVKTLPYKYRSSAHLSEVQCFYYVLITKYLVFIFNSKQFNSKMIILSEYASIPYCFPLSSYLNLHIFLCFCNYCFLFNI